jgi:sugar phosphate isomerase/epimerase
VQRIVSPRLRICWDAGNVSFYEGIFPDPDLPDVARQVAAVCVKDHLGGRAAANFPVPGQGQIDHPAMFQTLFAAGFEGPLGVERVEGQGPGKLTAEELEQRLAAAYQYLSPLLEKMSRT